VNTLLLWIVAVMLATLQVASGQSSVPLPSTIGSEAEGDRLENLARKNGDALIPTCRFEGARCGYIDRNGNTVLAPQFDWADLFVDGRALVGVAGKYRAIDTAGRFTTAPAYDSMSRFDRGLAVVRVGDRLGVIDQGGQWVVPAEHGLIVRIADDTFLVSEPPSMPSRGLSSLGDRLVRMHPFAYGKRWGIVAKSGTWVVQPKFAQVSVLSDDLNGLFWAADTASTLAHWQLMSRDGVPVSNELFDHVQQIQEGQDRAVVQRGGRWGAINSKGEIVVDLKFDWLGYFRDGWAPYRLEGREGQIDRNGNILANGTAQPSIASPNTAIKIIPGDKSADKARNGDALIRPVLPELPWSEGLAAQFDDKNSKWGFIDASKKSVIAPQFDAVSHFDRGVAWAAFPERREWCLIDKTGNIKPDTPCHCGQPLVIREHYRPPPDIACYDDGIRIVRGGR
jgi:hypothetical protein